MSEHEYERQRAYTIEDAKVAMKRMKEYLGEYPTTTQWREYRHELNITTDPSDVGNKSDYTFAEIRELLGGQSTYYDITPKLSSGMPDGVSYRITFDKSVDYDPRADAYVYVLKLYTEQDDEFYYVGQTTRLVNRLKAHGSKNGDIDFKPPDVEFINTEIMDIESFTKFLEGDKEFMKKVKNREREKSFEVARIYKTNNVLGGR